MNEWANFSKYRNRSLVYFHLFSVFSNLLMLVLPIYTIQIFNRVLFSNSAETLFFLVLIAIFLLAVQSVMEYARQQVLDNVALIYESSFKESLIKLDLFSRKGEGIEPSQHYQHHALAKQYLNSPFHRCSADLPWSIVFLIVLYILHPQLGSYALIVSIVLAMLCVWLIVESQSRSTLLKRSHAIQHRVLSNLFRRKDQGRPISFWDRELQRQQSLSDSVVDDELLSLKSNNRSAAITRLARVYIQVGVFAVGALLVIEQEIMAGSLLAASILLSRVLSPIEQGASHYAKWKESRQSFLAISSNLSAKSERRSDVDIPTDRVELVVDGLQYKGADGALLLKGINLALRPGSCLEVRGNAGAGKSTLLNLLSRTITPTSGKVRMNGVDIDQISIESFRQAVAFAPQDPDVLSATVADNISGFEKGSNVGQRVFKASHEAQCHLFVSRLSDSYATNLALSSIRLSLGERKRLNLARCFFASPKLLILDEPTLPGDPELSKSIALKLLSLKKAGTSIVIVTEDPELKKVTDYAIELNRGVVSKVVELNKAVNEVKSHVS